MTGFFVYVSVPQKSQMDSAPLEELRNIATLVGLALLHKFGWALGNEAADLSIFTTIRYDRQWAVLE